MAKVIDLESGELLGPGQDGELCVSGPQIMQCYHRNKRATRNTVKEHWLHTGDVARYREDGQFTIVDRLKELIKVKGYQVSLGDKFQCESLQVLFDSQIIEKSCSQNVDKLVLRLRGLGCPV